MNEHTPPRIYRKVERNSRGTTWSVHVEASDPVEQKRLFDEVVADMENRYGALIIETAKAGEG